MWIETRHAEKPRPRSERWRMWFDVETGEWVLMTWREA